MSTHIGASREDISNIVLMPGDPMRAKMIAEKYLTNAKVVNTIRGMYGFTGYFQNWFSDYLNYYIFNYCYKHGGKLIIEYKGVEITVMPSGMGIPSMGIYSYELFNDYNVNYIIRIGTCGAYTDKLKLNDVLLVDKSFSDTSYGRNLGYSLDNISGSDTLNNIIMENASKYGINITKANIHNTDAFYNDGYSKFLDLDCVGVEMESFSLFVNARRFAKHAATILTVSDNLVTSESMSSIDREKSTIKMIELALVTALNL